jgi:hypothetical protein
VKLKVKKMCFLVTLINFVGYFLGYFGLKQLGTSIGVVVLLNPLASVSATWWDIIHVLMWRDSIGGD